LNSTDPSIIVVAEQDLWRNRLAAAESRYHDADCDLKRLIATGARTESARAHKMEAREEYLRVLRIFTDLVLRGKSPATDN
jgi:hypothetical protein